ncbi:hypothetical protein BRD56_12270 [Thermoplasmatales archaeon SW_10_69_26]|nr:MAG: hypothetical protein BRD56_12270 [Thermoplasmatales archaeon SW_10_69_26]
MPANTTSAPSAVERLAERDIVVDHRSGCLRISPHSDKTGEDVWRVVKAVDAVAEPGSRARRAEAAYVNNRS